MTAISFRMIDRLNVSFSAEFLQLVNESSAHNVPEGSETHFKLVLVARAFEGMPRVRRHQAIYRELADFLNNGVHALAIHAYTPNEWLARDRESISSPACRGGA